MSVTLENRTEELLLAIPAQGAFHPCLYHRVYVRDVDGECKPRIAELLGDLHPAFYSPSVVDGGGVGDEGGQGSLCPVDSPDVEGAFHDVPVEPYGAAVIYLEIPGCNAEGDEMVVAAGQGIVSEYAEILVRRSDGELDCSGTPALEDVSAGLVYFHISSDFRGGGHP